MDNEQQKMAAASAAINYIDDDMVVGVGTGSTVNYFIDELAKVKHRIEAAVASSKATEARLKSKGIAVISLNSVASLPIYVDGADEINPQKVMIKGGGGALTGEKIVASVAEKFICIVDETKKVSRLGTFPLAIEVLPMARSYVGRELVKMGGAPEYRENFISDNGNIILDVYQLDYSQPIALEERLNNIAGVVACGLFAKRPADVVLSSPRD